jgi:hypothetical protein
MGTTRKRLSCWYAKAGLLVLLLAISGCGRSRPPGGTVTGTVTYKGEPVPAGQVSFIAVDGKSAMAHLDEEGNYEATDVPLGKVSVTVTTPPPAAGIENAAKNAPKGKRFGVGNPIVAPGKIVSVPGKYSDPAKSGYSTTVTEGTQTFNIDLK